MYWNIHTLVPLLALLSYSGLLLLVARARPQTQAHRFFELYLGAMLIWAGASFLAHAGLGPLTVEFKVMLATGNIAVLAILRFAVSILDPQRRSYRWFYLVGGGVVALVLLSDWVVGEVTVNQGVLSYDFRPGMAAVVLTALTGSILIVAELWRGHRQAQTERERNRLKYLLIGQCLVISTFPINFTSLGSYPIDIAINTVNALLIAYAMVRYELMDITLVVRKGLAYTALTVVLTGAYLVPISIFVLLIDQPTSGLGPFEFVFYLAVTMVMVMSIRPLHTAVQERIDRFFFRERYDAYQMVQELSQQVAATLDLDHLTAMLLDRIAETLHTKRLMLLLQDVTQGEFYPVATRGGTGTDTDTRWRSDHPIARWLAREGKVLTRRELNLAPLFRSLWDREWEELQRLEAELFVPLRVKESLVGILVVGSRQSEDPYTANDRDLLSTLANQVAVAVENARLYEETRRQAVTDGLTGLYNSRYFYQALEKELERSERYGHACSLIMLDLDNFKQYNDRYGHLAGDDLLRELAELLSEEVRQADLVARYGGDEFVVILPETEYTRAQALAERLQTKVQRDGLVAWQDREVGQTSISFGVATYPEHAQDVEKLIHTADTALLKAKAGENDWLSQHSHDGSPPLEGYTGSDEMPGGRDGKEAGVRLPRESVAPHQKVTEVDGAGLQLDHAADPLEFQAQLLDSVRESVVVTDLDGHVIYWNKGAEKLYGYTAEEAVDKHVSFIVAPEEREAEEHRMRQVRETGSWSGQYVQRRKDGTPFWADTVISLVTDHQGKPQGYIGIDRDITEQKRAEKERDRLLEQTRQRARQLAVLNDLAREMTGLMEVQTLCATVAQHVCTTFDYFNVSVFIVNLDSEEVILQAVAGVYAGVIEPGDYRQAFGEGLIGRAAATSEALVVNDTRQHPDFFELEGATIHSEVVIPLTANDEVIGVLNVDSDERDAFQDDDVALLTTVADQLTVALEKVRLFAAAHEHAELMDQLAVLSERLNRPSTVDEVIATIGEGALALSGADRAAVGVRDADEMMVVPWHKGVSSAYLEQVLDRLPEMPVGRMFEHPTPAFIGDVAQLPADSAVRELAGEEGYRALGVWPLLYEGRMLANVACYYDTPHAWTDTEQEVMRAFCRQSAVALENARLYEDLETAYVETILALSNAMDARDAYTADHSERLAAWSVATAEELGCTTAEIADLRWAALLHDIGKIGVPDRILQKPGPLTEGERAVIERHPEIGAEIVAPVQKLSQVAPLIRAHQEWWDGSGYPDGLCGEEIPLGARILAVVDAYGAMTDKRPYKEARSHEEAVAELKRCAGTQFDPRVVEAFLTIITAEQGEKPVGSG